MVKLQLFCPRGPSCVMGGVFVNVVIPFQFPARLRVHSGEGVNGELWLCYMAIGSVKVVDQNFHIRRVFLFLARGGSRALLFFPSRDNLLNLLFLLIVGLVMASGEDRQGGRSLGSSFSMKLMIKALSGRHGSPPKTPSGSPSPEPRGEERAETFVSTEIFPPEGFFDGMER